MIGAVLDGRFRVLKMLGEGSMGEVYLVEHLALRRKEALKVLRHGFSREPRFVSRFRREARIINRLQHPNVVGLYDFGQLLDGRFYLAIEYAEGLPLDAVLRTNGALSVARSLRILSQLAEAVDHAHARGVVHRDLKPENLLLVEHRGKADVLKVLDFGIAKILGAADAHDRVALTAHGEIVGTVYYLAPERVTGDESQSASDLYSIGCIAMELLTGEPPFMGRTMQIMEGHLHGTPPLASVRNPSAGIPRVLDDVIQRLLAKRPGDRYPSGAALKEALTHVPGFDRRRSTGGFRPAGAESGAIYIYDDGETAQDEREVSSGVRDPASFCARTREVADAVIDTGLAGALVALALARLKQHENAWHAHATSQEQLEQQIAASDQAARERIANLRFSLGELRFERAQMHGRDRPVSSDFDREISDLEHRIIETEKTYQADLATLAERSLAFAVEESALEERATQAAADVVTQMAPLADADAPAEVRLLVEQLTAMKLRAGGG